MTRNLRAYFIGGGPVTAVVMLLNPSNLEGPSSSAAGIKIDFGEAMGQNDKCWLTLGSGPGLTWTLGWGQGAKRITKKCTRVADRAFPEVKVPPRQPGDFWSLGRRKPMKALIAIFAALAVPIFILNLLGGVVSGIWLAVLGNWAPIFLGIAGMLFSSFLLAIAMMPGLLFALPLVKLEESGRYVLLYILAFIGASYTLAVVTVWCILVMRHFMGSATESNYIPLMIWSYGVATSPLVYMASKDKDNEASFVTAFFASIAYIVTGLWVLLGQPSIRDAIVLFGAIMLVGACFMFVSSLELIRRKREIGIY